MIAYCPDAPFHGFLQGLRGILLPYPPILMPCNKYLFKTTPLSLALALALPWALPNGAFAHAIGQSLEKEVGEYLVDIGYDAVDINAGQEVLFNAVLIRDPGTSAWQYGPYDEVWLQIKRGNAEPFRAIIPVRQPSPVNVRYRFPEAGTYQLSARFLAGDTVLADASFALPVYGASDDGTSVKAAALILFGSMLFLVIGVVWYRRYTPTPLPQASMAPRKTSRTKAKVRRRRS
jgi:hypothetical protein